MTFDSKVDSDSLSQSDAKRAWISQLFKLTGAGDRVNAAVQTKTAPGVTPAPGAVTCDVPDATATDFFFDYNSADLTPSDKTWLEAYAKVYLNSKVSEAIVVEGYASIDGDKDKNLSLSRDRAAQVARYLIVQKVPKGSVTFRGKGPTDSFSKSDACQNRRATIKPTLNLTVRDFVDVVEIEPGNVPIPGKKPNVSLGEKADEPDYSQITIPEPPAMVSRDEVEKALKDWLIALGKSQKVKTRDSVYSTSRVNVAEETLLGERLGEALDRLPITPANGNGRGHDAAELAHSIAQNLPDEIPKKNFDNFKKLQPVEAPKEESTLDHARAKLDKKADQILSDFHVPEKYWSDIKDAVRKHTPDLIDKLPIDSTLKDGMKKAYDKINKSGEDE